MTDLDRAYWLFNHQDAANQLWQKFQLWRREECAAWRPYSLKLFCRLHRQEIDAAITDGRRVTPTTNPNTEIDSMKRADQKRIVKEMNQSIAKHFAEAFKAGKIPEHWDGLELRQLLVDYAAGFAPGHCSTWTRKRQNSFKADCYANNL